MNKQIVMIAAALLLGTASFAQGAGPRGGAPGGQGQVRGQGGPGAGGRGMGMQKQILEKLGLSAAQKAQIEKLNKEQADKVRAKWGKNKPNTGAKPDMEAFRAEAKKMREAYLASLKKVLTPAQFKKFNDLMAAERAKREKNRPGPGAQPGAKGGKGGKIKP